MSDDRYAPPQANLTPATAGVPGTGSFDLGLAFNEAWSATWANFGLLLGVGVVAVLLMLASAVTIVGIFLLVPVFAWGGIRFMLNVIDGNAEFGDLFCGFQDYGRTLLAMLILYVLWFIVGLPAFALQTIAGISESAPLWLLGQLIALLWALAVTSRLFFAWFYAVDQALGPVEALQVAWDVTSNLKLNSALLALMWFVISVIGFLAFIVGLIPASMIVLLLYASAYRQMAGRRSDAA